MSTYKLTYFNFRGAGEPIRIIFAQAGVKYEDVRVSYEQWPDKKQYTPFGRMPVLEVDGKTELAGSLNILRYLGIKFGMAGKDELANAVLGGASDYIADISAKMVQVYDADDSQRGKLTQEFKEKTWPQMLGTLQKHVKDGHINGSETMSWVDIQCYYLLESLSEHFKVNITDYPELKKLYDNVTAQPNIKKWLEERPKTDI